MQLLGEVLDVIMGHLCRVNVVLNGIVFRGQTECVIADGEQHIVAVHAALAGYHVHSGVGTCMTHMQTLTGGIGELYQSVELRFVGIVFAGESFFVLPALLPFFLNGGKIIIHCIHALFII